MSFTERFKELKKAQKLNNAAIARQLVVSPSTVKEWEKGKRIPSLEQMINLAQVFGVSSDYLSGRADALGPVINVPQHNE